MKTLREFRETRRLMTREEYNAEFTYQFETDPSAPEYDPNILWVVAYGDGAHVLMYMDRTICRPYFWVGIMNKEYKSFSIYELEERLWDDFVKDEHSYLSTEEKINDYKLRIQELMAPDNGIDISQRIAKSNQLFNEMLQIS